MSDTLANGGQVVVASHEGSFGDDKEYDLTATRVNPDGTTEEALAYFVRKFSDLEGQVSLLEQRVSSR